MNFWTDKICIFRSEQLLENSGLSVAPPKHVHATVSHLPAKPTQASAHAHCQVEVAGDTSNSNESDSGSKGSDDNADSEADNGSDHSTDDVSVDDPATTATLTKDPVTIAMEIGGSATVPTQTKDSVITDQPATPPEVNIFSK